MYISPTPRRVIKIHFFLRLQFFLEHWGLRLFFKKNAFRIGVSSSERFALVHKLDPTGGRKRRARRLQGSIRSWPVPVRKRPILPAGNSLIPTDSGQKPLILVQNELILAGCGQKSLALAGNELILSGWKLAHSDWFWPSGFGSCRAKTSGFWPEPVRMSEFPAGASQNQLVSIGFSSCGARTCDVWRQPARISSF